MMLRGQLAHNHQDHCYSTSVPAFQASLQLDFNQMMTFSVWIFGLLLISLTGVHGLSHFPENFVVAKKDQATLTCGSEIDGPVTWKFDGKELEDENVKQVGQNLTVLEVDTPSLGEYNCYRREEMLSSIYLLLEEQEGQELDSLIRCRAKSYDCNFSCSSTPSDYTAMRLGLGHDCSVGLKSCQWVSGQRQDETFQFELSHTLSPFAEESTMLELTVEAIADLTFFKSTKRFYLRDIVQPDSPLIVKCQEVDQGLNVTIDPPSSWSTPHSFFSLEHDIEYELRDDGRIERSSSTLIPKRISKLRVRSRDSLVFSNWSQWTPWKNVRTGTKGLCRCKRPEKYCCPELSSKFFDKCKKKQEKKQTKKKKS